MAGVTISSAVRTNLLSLQDITSQQSIVQNRLATGKKVNSALDNATSFFTASAFTSRAASLSALQDSISTGVQTLQAANNGISAINNLVSQLRSTAQQALQSTTAYTSQAKVTSSSAITGATSADLRGVGAATATGALSTLTSRTQATISSGNTVASALTATGVNTATTGDIATGKTFTVGDGTSTATVTLSGTNTADAATFVAAINTAATTAGAKFKAELDTTGKLKLTGTGNGEQITVGGTATNLIGSGALNISTSATTNGAAGDQLSISDGTTSKTFTYDSAATAADALAFGSITDLNSKISAQSIKATAVDSGGGKLKLTAADSSTTLTVGGAAQGSGKLNIAASIASPLNGKTLTFNVGSDSKTVTFGDPATTTGAIKSLDDLNSSLSGVGISASLDSSGNLAFQTTSTTASKSFSIAGTAAGSGTSFTTVASTSPVRGGSGADSRDSLVTQYNNLLTQINSAAKDANFNGLNLLSGDTLSLIFNETNTSKLDVNGTSANATGLGLSTVTASDFNDGTGLNSVLSKIDTAKNSLSTQASKFGSNLAVVQTRQSFTKNTISTLNTGADNLVNADLNEEATNLLSLNTSQSLAQQALSLANQSQQSVLQLIR